MPPLRSWKLARAETFRQTKDHPFDATRTGIVEATSLQRFGKPPGGGKGDRLVFLS